MSTPYRVVPARRTPVGLIILGLLCAVVGLGFYLGWFRITEQREAVGDKVDVNLTVDRAKIKSDLKHATEKTEQKASALSDKIKQGADDLKDRATHKQ